MQKVVFTSWLHATRARLTATRSRTGMRRCDGKHERPLQEENDARPADACALHRELGAVAEFFTAQTLRESAVSGPSVLRKRLSAMRV